MTKAGNLLMVTRNPIEGDIFYHLAYPLQAQRKGTCRTFRNLDIFHASENVLHLHEPDDTPLAETNENAVLMNILSLMILTRICNLLLQCLGVCQVFTR